MEVSHNRLGSSPGLSVELEKLCPLSTDKGSVNCQIPIENWGTFEFLDEFRRFKLGSCDTKKFSFNDETYSKPKELVRKIFQESFDCKIIFGKTDIKEGRFKQTISVPDPDDDKTSSLPILNIDIISNSKLVQHCYLYIIRQTGEEIYQEVVKNVVEAAIKADKPGRWTEITGHPVYDVIKNGELKIKFLSPQNIFKGSNPSGRVGSFRNILITHKDRARATPNSSIMDEQLKGRESLPATPIRSAEPYRPKSQVSKMRIQPTLNDLPEVIPLSLTKVARKSPTQFPKVPSRQPSRPENPTLERDDSHHPQLQPLARKSRISAPYPPQPPIKLYGLQDLLSDLRLSPKPLANKASQQQKYPEVPSFTASTRDRSSAASNESFLNISGFGGWPNPSQAFRARTLDVGQYLVRLSREAAETKVKDAADLINQASRFPEVQPMLSRCGKILLVAHGIDITTRRREAFSSSSSSLHHRGGLKVKDYKTDVPMSAAAPYQYAHDEPVYPFKNVNDSIPAIGNSSWAISEAKEEMRTKLQDELLRIHAKFFAGQNKTSKGSARIEAPKPPRTRNVCILDDDSDCESVVCVPDMKCIPTTPVARTKPSDRTPPFLDNILGNQGQITKSKGDQEYLYPEHSFPNPLTNGVNNPLTIEDENSDILESDSEWTGIFTTPTVNDLLLTPVWVTFKAEQLPTTQKTFGGTKEQDSWKGSVTVAFGKSASKSLAAKPTSQPPASKTINLSASTRMGLHAQLGIALGVLLFKDYSTMTIEQLWDRCTALVVQLSPKQQQLVNAKEPEDCKPAARSSATPKPEQWAGQYLGKRPPN